MTIPTSDAGFLPESCCLPLAPDEEKEEIRKLVSASEGNVSVGDLFFVISSRWWTHWQKYVGFERPHPNQFEAASRLFCRPGEIDNSLLISGESKELDLKRNLQEGEDYMLLHSEVWKKLHEWYKGGPELPRKVIDDGPSTSKNCVVEVYPLRLQLVDARDNSSRSIRISRKAKVDELYSMVCIQVGVNRNKAHIWDFYLWSKTNELLNFDQTMEEASLQMDQEILLELESDDNVSSDFNSNLTGNELALVSWEPSTISKTIAGGPGPALPNGHSTEFGYSAMHGNSFSSSWVTGNSQSEVKVRGHGLTGLNNLGNTCFMNSAIQCLVHTPPLLDYFLKSYTDEINKENPLGMQGELATAFGALLRQLWSSGHTSVAPREFKSKLAQFAPQFSGYNQHDSQELLAFLLDGLHEDLNRVKTKPYIELKDADGCPDEQFSEECWLNHKARNDSVIVDTCQGQFKSTLVCPDCSKVSVTFDPFMYLSLPLPSMVIRSMTVSVISGLGDALPMPYTVTVSKIGCCQDLISAVGTACCLNASETLLLAEVYDRQIYRFIERNESLEEIKDGDQIVAYKLPVGHEKLQRIVILHQRADRTFLEREPAQRRDFIGAPLVTCIPKNSTTLANINSAVLSVHAPFVRATSSPMCRATGAINGCASSLRSFDSADETDPSSTMELEEDDDEARHRHSFFELALTNQKCSSRIPLNVDSNPVLGSCMRLLVDWTDAEREKYTLDYLENLPDVFKPGGIMAKKTRQETVDLFSCLDAFLKEEPLGPDDMWYCPRCKEHKRATKKLDLWRLPEILVIHLKRFSYSRYTKDKLDTYVNFTIHKLDLRKYVPSPLSAHPQEYELYAVINHYGGLSGGHYSSYAKVKENKWYHFDDSHVSSVGEEDIRTSAAYVLFYQQITGRSNSPHGKSSTSRT